MVTTDVILLLAFFVITLIVMLGMARELNIARRSSQESAALLRRLVESMAPGAAKDVPITTEEEPKGLKIPPPAESTVEARGAPKKKTEEGPYRTEAD